MRRIGVILAAGRGSRFGRTKQTSLWPGAAGSRPLVAAAYDAIRPICDTMIVVLGHDAEVVAAALGDRAFHRAQSSANVPMFESIRAGLSAALDVDGMATIVLQPADQPEVDRSTLATLVGWSQRQPEVAVIPQLGDRGGHPVLIPPVVARLILRAECPDGLGEFWRHRPELCVRVVVHDSSVLLDVDTPDDLPP